MRYWRLLFVPFLLTFLIAGCHRKVERALPPPQAQAPPITPAPTLPPLTSEPVILAGATPAAVAPPPVETPPPPKPAAKIRHRRTTPKPKPESEPAETPSTTENATPATTIIGQLSADDATTTPAGAAQTQHLIARTENKLKKLSARQQTDHKDAVAQVASFLAQARQALSMNDVVGAQTLANKAEILVDELSK
jgi:hypothetical protein